MFADKLYIVVRETDDGARNDTLLITPDLKTAIKECRSLTAHIDVKALKEDTGKWQSTNRIGYVVTSNVPLLHDDEALPIIQIWNFNVNSNRFDNTDVELTIADYYKNSV